MVWTLSPLTRNTERLLTKNSACWRRRPAEDGGRWRRDAKGGRLRPYNQTTPIHLANLVSQSDWEADPDAIVHDPVRIVRYPFQERVLDVLQGGGAVSLGSSCGLCCFLREIILRCLGMKRY